MLFQSLSKIFFFSGITLIGLFLLIILIRFMVMKNYYETPLPNFQAPASKIMDNDQDTFSFAVVSDSGARNEPIEQILNEVRKSKAKFIIHLGDMVRYRNAAHFSWVVDEFAQKLRGLPFYAVPGNHELVKLEGKYDRSLYIERFGAPYYWFSYGNTLFIALDTADNKIDAQQQKWLRDILKHIRPSFRHCIVYSHIPPHSPHGERYRHLDHKSVAILRSIIHKSNVSLLLFGHVHYFARSKFAGVPLVTLMSSGQQIRSKINQYGYAMVKVSPEGIKVKERYINSGNGTEYFELFMTSAPLHRRLLRFSFWLLGAGLMLTLLSLLLKKFRI